MKRYAALFIVLLLTSQSLWADVRASLSRQTLYEGDTVSLNIVSNESAQGADPELSVLQQDFEIVGTASSQQTSIINGKRSETRQWHIELAPKRAGELTVPSIRVGADSTQALTLQVSAQPDAVVAEAGQPVFIKTQLEPLDSPVYVQQQLRYTLQLFYRVPLFEGSFDGPNVEHALVERLGEDMQYKTTVNGTEYQVVERHIAIFPEQSGALSISPVTFNGRLAGQSQQRMPSMFMDDMLERFFSNTTVTAPGKRVRLRSEGYTLEVKPRAAAFTGDYWLPSEQLTLTDSWTSGPPEFRSGVPVTRTLTLQARGLESTHLPEFKLPETDGMRLYPEQPVYNNRTDGEWVIGSRQLTVAYVPSTSGMQTIPAMKIDWWDTSTEQQKTAELPAWSVNVLPGNGATDTQPPVPLTPVEVAREVPVDETMVPAADTTGRVAWQAAIKSRWPWLLAGLVILAASLVLWRGRNFRETPTPATGSTAPSASASLKAARSAVQQACQANNPAAAANALLQWAAASWPQDPPLNLGALMQRLSSGVNEIQILERALYSAAAEPWQGDALWRMFDQGLEMKHDTGAAARAGLSPLYPDWKT
ncbi:MAG: BatD family protein [Gammaproteobacteria bacterium]